MIDLIYQERKGKIMSNQLETNYNNFINILEKLTIFATSDDLNLLSLKLQVELDKVQSQDFEVVEELMSLFS